MKKIICIFAFAVVASVSAFAKPHTRQSISLSTRPFTMAITADYNMLFSTNRSISPEAESDFSGFVNWAGFRAGACATPYFDSHFFIDLGLMDVMMFDDKNAFAITVYAQSTFSWLFVNATVGWMHKFSDKISMELGIGSPVKYFVPLRNDGVGIGDVLGMIVGVYDVLHAGVSISI